MRVAGRRSPDAGRRTSRSKPVVSVITVVRNDVEHIEETIRAVADQTYPNIEHIVVDGASTDGTLDVLIRNDSSIDYWMSEPDKGLYDAMNKGIDLVRDPQSYVLFANSGDRLQSRDAIEQVISKSSGEDLIYGKMLFTDGEISGTLGREVDLADLARETLCHPATLVRRAVFDRVGKFDTRYKIAADYDFIVRCFATGVSTRFVDVIVSRMTMGGLSDDRFMLSCRERKRVIRQRFPLLPRLAGVWQVNLYDIPRNAARRFLAQAGLLAYWRALKGS